MFFSEMKYSRPDIVFLAEKCGDVEKRILNANSCSQAEEAFLEFDTVLKNWVTNTSIAYIRHTVDTNDKFYCDEDDYINEISPKAEELFQAVNKAVFESPFRAELELKFGSLMFQNIEISLKSFSPQIIPDMQEENRLSSEYQKLIASAQIEFDGKTLNLSQMSPYKTSADNKIREAAWKADGEWYRSNGEKLDDIYDKLVKCRTEQAKKLGYNDFVTLGYYRMTRNCYDKKDVEIFRNNIIKFIVPICEKLAKEKASRLGFNFPLSYSDNALDFRSGNPRPRVSSDEILAHGKKFYHELSSETTEFIDFMYDNQLLDVLSKQGKAAGGYCTEIPDYKAPFIFANFNGTAHDVDVITHEAGHAFAFYTAKDIVPFANMSPTIESCEIHSTSMEFFAWEWAEGFFKEDAEKYRYYHLSSTLMILPYIALVDHFQHTVYEQPSLSPAERHELWKSLVSIYMPWIKLDGSVFYGEGKAWQRQLHIYQNPFYYIDYAFAITVALEFWALMQNDRKNAWERYMRLVKKAGTQTYKELVQTAGLDTPFDEGSLKKIVDAAQIWLEKTDFSKL